MSKITNDGITRSGTKRIMYTHMPTVDVKGLSDVSTAIYVVRPISESLQSVGRKVNLK